MKLRFSIRDLLWLTLVIGILLAWRADHRHLSPGWEYMRMAISNYKGMEEEVKKSKWEVMDINSDEVVFKRLKQHPPQSP